MFFQIKIHSTVFWTRRKSCIGFSLCLCRRDEQYGCCKIESKQKVQRSFKLASLPGDSQSAAACCSFRPSLSSCSIKVHCLQIRNSTLIPILYKLTHYWIFPRFFNLIDLIFFGGFHCTPFHSIPSIWPSAGTVLYIQSAKTSKEVRSSNLCCSHHRN